MRFGLDALGRWTAERTFTIDRDRVKAYAAATDETVPAYTSGDVAPALYAFVPTWDAVHEATEAVVPAEARPKVLHGEQDMLLHAALSPGMELIARAAVVGVHPKSSGTTVVIKIETRGDGGALVSEQYATEFYRGVVADEGAGETPPGHRAPDGLSENPPIASVTYPVAEDQTFRYAEASGDHNIFHLDDEAARALGLPGKIVHGMCVMAFTGRAVLEAADPKASGRLRRLAVRFSRPVFPGAALTTRIWQVGPDVYAYDTLDDAGEAVIRDGWAELERANAS